MAIIPSFTIILAARLASTTVFLLTFRPRAIFPRTRTTCFPRISRATCCQPGVYIATRDNFNVETVKRNRVDKTRTKQNGYHHRPY